MEFWFFSNSSSDASSSLYALIGTIFAALIAALAAIRTVHINFKSKNVSEERIKWRERVRYLTRIIVSNEDISRKKIAVLELETRFNPCDTFDQELINFARYVSESECKFGKDVFVRLISIYLKYDWERCKLDAYFFKCVYYVSVKKQERTEYIEPYPRYLDRVSISIKFGNCFNRESKTLAKVFSYCYPFKDNIHKLTKVDE